MPLLGYGTACPICGAGLSSADNVEHWLHHTFRITVGAGTGGYTWICSCGPSALYWEQDYAAVAGLAIHMLDHHQIGI